MKPVPKLAAWLIIMALQLVGLASCGKSLPTRATSIGAPNRSSDGMVLTTGPNPLEVPGQAIVVLEDETKLNDFLVENGLENLATLVVEPTIYHLVRSTGESFDLQMVDHLQQAHGVTSAESNFLLENPEGGGENMAFDDGDIRGASSYDGQEPAGRIHLAEALEWSQTDGAGVTVAILDTGGEDTHPAFNGMLDSWTSGFGEDGSELLWRSRETANGVNEDGDALKDEASGHGTHVAGIVHLVAPSARIFAVRVLNDDGWGTVFSVSQGLMYAAYNLHAQVINMSLGLETRSGILEEAVKGVTTSGVQVVASAGNRASRTPQYPASFPLVLSVAGVAKGDALWDYSNYNSEVDLTAPGVNIVSPIPHMLGLSGDYAVGTGTSMAAAFVTGAVALTMSTLQCTPQAAGDRVRNSATPIDYLNAGHGGLIGRGRVDCLAALSTGPQLTP